MKKELTKENEKFGSKEYTTSKHKRTFTNLLGVTKVIMKRIIFLMVVLIGICNLEILLCQDQYDDDPLINRDNFGKVVGQIIDPETDKPVNERFRVCLFNWNYREGDYERYIDCNFKSDEKGYISIELPPGIYGLLFAPTEPESKYSRTYYPLYEKMPLEYQEMFRCPIKVETGKITKFIKKAIIGGAIRVTLVDLAGNPVDPEIAFPGRSITIMGYLINHKLGPGNASFNFRLKNGQYTRARFFPDNSWELKVEFLGIGYGIFEKENIVIKAKQVTEINVAIDPNDITGVEGKIVDELGNPQKEVRISFYQKDESIEGSFRCYTDSNGHYLMTGMPEGFYEIGVYDGHEFYFMYQNIITIEIKKNILLKKDLTISKSE